MRKTLGLATIVLLAACPGGAPGGGNGGGDDVGPEVDAAVDAPPNDPGQRVTGKTMDYFTANTPMADALIASDGVTPAMSATSAMTGEFTFEGVPTGSKIFFSVTKANYRPTRNVAVTVEGAAVTQDLYMVSTTDAARQYTTAGLQPVQGVGKAILFAELQRNNGMPIDGIPLTDVKLLDAQDAPVPGLVGPFAMGPVDITPLATTTTLVGGKVRIAILQVPPGTYKLEVTYLNSQNQPDSISTPVTVTADGATLAKTGGMGGGMNGGGNNIPANPTFAADIYPRLQRVTAGGLGCANCHTGGGQAAILAYDLPAADVLAALKARPGVIDLVAPELSTFLTAPLYEPPPSNHPNATFIDTNDPDYKLFLRWIQQGAL